MILLKKVIYPYLRLPECQDRFEGIHRHAQKQDHLVAPPLENFIIPSNQLKPMPFTFVMFPKTYPCMYIIFNRN
jgi:hypothetical protein